MNGKEDNHFLSFDSETHQHSNNGSIPTYVCEIYVEAKPLDISFNIKDCEGVLDPDFCSEILPRDLFNRWGKALCESALLASEKFYCPYQDCSALLVNDGEKSIQRSRCPLCKRVFCVQCNVAWHSGVDCNKFQKLKTLGSDAMFVNLATRKKWRQCPNCKMLVGKSFGCHHVKCRSVWRTLLLQLWRKVKQSSSSVVHVSMGKMMKLLMAAALNISVQHHSFVGMLFAKIIMPLCLLI
ncbi:hypothetical protein ES288_D13G017600v1 [Gossypium darwinii]|uniref:RBR-type E3 ubiquitin transferase n=1 Tax=Gossypium darwinii TaxID=34276 RepID=A0A5D1ZWU3_GOSDA|nr:hypothetical protein ES288_D13G017600v1 [Gossypium darwinii]